MYEMYKEQVLFLDCLKNYIHLEKTKNEWSNIGENVVCEYALRHQLAPVLYYQCKPHFQELQSTYLMQISNSVQRKRVVNDLQKALTNIKYAFIKGSVIADLYPIPELRSMGDVDVVIEKSDIDLVIQRLTQLSFCFNAAHEDYDEWLFSKNGINIEVHTSLVRKDQATEKVKLFFDNIFNYMSNGILDWNFHFLYLLVHLRSHFLTGGVGFRQFLDMAVLTQRIKLDWDWIKEKADELGLIKFLGVVLALNKRWFDVDAPLCAEITDAFFKQATEEIFENGVFGNKQMIQSIPKQIIITGETNLINRISYLLKQAFPSYSVMAKKSYCRYIRTMKCMLPIAWIHRGILRITNNKHRTEFLNRTVSSDEAIARYAEWGLL